MADTPPYFVQPHMVIGLVGHLASGQKGPKGVPNVPIGREIQLVRLVVDLILQSNS
jgi:hypothetical protein